MKSLATKSERKDQSNASQVAQRPKQSGTASGSEFSGLQQMASASNQVRQLQRIQDLADSHNGSSQVVQQARPVQYKKWKALKGPDIAELVISLKQYISMGLLKVSPMDGVTIPANDNTQAVLEAVLGEAGIDEEMPKAREALLQAAGLQMSKEVVISEKFSISAMKRNAFATILTGKLGCTSQGKDGQNHDIYLNPATGRTTSLGIGGHGNPTQDEGVLKTYLSQLGITASEWNRTNG